MESTLIAAQNDNLVNNRKHQSKYCSEIAHG